MKGTDRRFDALVIGSGAAGSIAVKELTERGLDVLLLEAGRDLMEADFTPPPPKAPRQLGMDFGPRLRAAIQGQHMQARRTFFSETTNRFLVDDRQNPYSTPRDVPYLWSGVGVGRAPYLDREGVQGAGDPAVVAARPASPPNLVAASAGAIVG